MEVQTDESLADSLGVEGVADGHGGLFLEKTTRGQEQNVSVLGNGSQVVDKVQAKATGADVAYFGRKGLPCGCVDLQRGTRRTQKMESWVMSFFPVHHYVIQ